MKVLHADKWKTGEHPYGHPLSLYVNCLPAPKLEYAETEKIKFFSLNNLPKKIVEPHRRFMETLLPKLELDRFYFPN